MHRRTSWGLFLSFVCILGCETPTSQNQPTTGSGGSAGTGGAGGANAGGAGGGSSASAVCETLGLSGRPFSDGSTGINRRDIAADFTLDLINEPAWQFKTQWSGCENYVFIPDSLRVSAIDDTSIWEADIDRLLKLSPQNVHYFFFSRAATDSGAKTNLEAMRARIDQVLDASVGFDGTFWRSRMHVVAKRAGAVGGWLQDAMGTHGLAGLAIDQQQKIRGLGSFADVNRMDPDLQAAMQWPWKANLAYASYESRYLNFDAEQQKRLDAETATVIPMWNGEVLEEFAETDIVLPSADEMAQFDTLEVDIEMGCPNPTAPELGNCGAWDYLAWLSVRNEAMENVEIARFITSYHRETHWVADISPMLALLQKGGMQHFRWDFAPNWNKQPTATKISLRFSNRNKGYRPVRATFLWKGGDFNSMYNMSHAPQDVAIAPTSKRVELWALITGHGADTYQCAEFCNHRHEVTVNGTPFLKEHKEAGSKDKCIPESSNGMVPNQGGTWWFGRGGWCPGQKVYPWIVDVTTNVTPGMPATLTYKGLYGTSDPPDMSGNINLVSYLVEYE